MLNSILSINTMYDNFSVVEVGFVQSEYTVSELNRSVIVCAAVKQGILGVPIPMSIISHSLTALGKDMCMYIHAHVYVYVCFLPL